MQKAAYNCKRLIQGIVKFNIDEKTIRSTSRAVMKFMPLTSDTIKINGLMPFSKDFYLLYGIQNINRTLEGIICLFELSSIQKIKIHEHENTIVDKTNIYLEDFLNTKIQYTPILVAYDKTQFNLARSLHNLKTKKVQLFNISCPKSYHSLKYIEDTKDVSQISYHLGKLKEIYLIDGHHRLNAAKDIVKIKGKYHLMVMLVAKDQLMLDAFHRVIQINNKSVSFANLLKNIQEKFVLQSTTNCCYIPKTNDHYGMYLNGKWYKLFPQDIAVNQCDSQNLSKSILEPLLKISKQNDSKITYLNSSDLRQHYHQYLNTIIFSISPLSIDDYMTVVRNNIMLPAHSTCFLPKPYNDCIRFYSDTLRS